MLILGIETSCDESGLALYDTQKGLLAHALHSQINLHRRYGGVVPELASRDHIKQVLPLLTKLLLDTNKNIEEISAISYTMGPGLSGALLVGASIAESLSFSLNIPCIGVHHLEGHLLSPLLEDPNLPFPFIALLVSGGHTQIIKVDQFGEYCLLGETLDDAAGEAFDKTAKLMGLPYPGGPEIAKLAEKGTAGHFKLPRPLMREENLNFSFSGLKTSVSTLFQTLIKPDQQTLANLALEVETAIVESLLIKCEKALQKTNIKTLVISGGVASNTHLRRSANNRLQNIKVIYPRVEFCTDNGAMIALVGALRLQKSSQKNESDGSFTINPRWRHDFF